MKSRAEKSGEIQIHNIILNITEQMFIFQFTNVKKITPQNAFLVDSF